METGLEKRIAVGRQVVEGQIPYFVESFGRVASDWKYDGSRVTEADLHLSGAFSAALLDEFPDDQFFSEELEHGDDAIAATSRFAWLVDPIDGTNNFARGIPNCSISVALLEEGNPVYGYIYDHGTRQLVHGGSDRGLWLDDRRQERMATDIGRQSILSIQSLDDETALKEENALQMRFKQRAFGSSAIHMAYAALGWTDGLIAHRVKSWDIAAGVAILAAVGGSTRFFDTEVFPVREFSTKTKGFGHIAGSHEMCDAIEETIGRRCSYRI